MHSITVNLISMTDISAPHLENARTSGSPVKVMGHVYYVRDMKPELTMGRYTFTLHETREDGIVLEIVFFGALNPIIRVVTD